MAKTRYEKVYHNRFIAQDAKSIGDMVRILEEKLALFRRWEEKGIELDPYSSGTTYAIFYTYDEQVAREEGFDRLRTESGNPLPHR
jgi:hypothetical protein